MTHTHIHTSSLVFSFSNFSQSVCLPPDACQREMMRCTASLVQVHAQINVLQYLLDSSVFTENTQVVGKYVGWSLEENKDTRGNQVAFIQSGTGFFTYRGFILL